MSYAATQKQQHHIHIPWPTVVAVALAVAVAAAVLVLVNQPTTQTQSGSVAVAPAVAAQAAAVPLPESPALRQRLAAEVATQVGQSEQFAYPRNHVIGATLEPAGAALAAGHLAGQAAPNDPYPLNHFPTAP
jgi:hypothetical protein